MWLRRLVETLLEVNNPEEFLEHTKLELFHDQVFCFTPKGKLIALPRKATPIDFAYAVHTDIGNRCVAAKVNGELVPLRTELRNGDRVEIITASHAKPNPGWLQYVRTGKARSNIRHFLKTMQYEESASLGERLLDQALKSLTGSHAEIHPAKREPVVPAGRARLW
jgi:GTP diphosphokinase / guanosine-3',5'-bis(diphosphate) 3'-diphosphatase